MVGMNRHPKSLYAGLAVALAVAIGCGVTSAPAPDPLIAPTVTIPATPASPAAADPAPTKAAVQPPKPAGFGDGQYEIGVDLKAGTYTTTVPADTFGCYWARLKSFDGEFQSIIANDNLSPGAKGRVVVKASDKGIEFNGGCEWSKAAAR